MFEANSEYVTLSNFLNAEKHLYSRSQLVKEITELSEQEFSSQYPCSFRLTNVQVLSPPIMQICRQLAQSFNKTVFCNLYFTPGVDRNCFDYHSDIQETFIIQLKGCKEWKFPLDEKGEVVRLVKDLSFDKEELIPGRESTLLLNQWEQLYVPYAIAHGVEIRGDGPSLHLTFASYENQIRTVSNHFMNELLALANMQDKQYEKIELDEVRQMLGVLKKAAFSLNADKLASKILNEAFINDLRASKLGRIYPLQK
jgi:ribosomal protein L16 Arg81 hydroxylase